MSAVTAADIAAADGRVLAYYDRALAGHVYLRDTIDALLLALGPHVERLGGAARLLEVGCHAGVPTGWFLERWPGLDIVVQDERAEAIAVGRRQLAGRAVQFIHGPLDAIAEPCDLAVSIARHHHLPPEYMAGVHRALKPGGIYLVADELCPEYCDGADAARIRDAELVHVAGGYVLTSAAEVAAFRADGTLPQAARALEQRRRRALWRWYRFVVDHAVDRGHFDVAVDELQSTHDDLITGSDAEHKLSPLIVERQLELAGFRLLAKQIIGPTDDVERQGMFVYQFARV